MRVLRFLWYSISKTFIIVVVFLAVVLLADIILNNGVVKGWEAFKNGGVLSTVFSWVKLWFRLFKSATPMGIFLGILAFYIPIFIVTFFTPDPPVLELYDGDGNIWTLTKK